MTMATLPADGVSPRGTILRLCGRFVAELTAAGQVLAVGGAAIALLAAAQPVPRQIQPPQPAYRSQFEAPVALSPPAPAVPTDGYSKPMLQALLTKAGLRPNYELRRLSEIQARRVNAVMPAAGASQTARPFLLSVDTKDGREALHCLTQAAYFEAGGNGPEAQAGVVQVVLNRMRHPDFPKSVCGVVYQGAARKTGCQFTFTCDGSLNRPLDAAAWSRARAVALRALNGYVDPAVGAATYYHADYVFPTWAPTLVKLATVGPHIFYRMTGAAGDAAALTGRYAGGELKVSRAILAAADGLARKGSRAATVTLASAGPSERVHMRMAVSGDARPEAVLAAAQPAPAAAAAPAAQVTTIAPTVSAIATSAAPPA
jgi:spore germination cell wall hydrolase CwlJ-like protein